MQGEEKSLTQERIDQRYYSDREPVETEEGMYFEGTGQPGQWIRNVIRRLIHGRIDEVEREREKRWVAKGHLTARERERFGD